MVAGNRRHALITCFCLLLTVLIVSPSADPARAGSAARTLKPPIDKLATLSWMAGQWIRNDGKDQLEETWSEPSHDSVMGMFRWIKSGKVWMFELMTITVDGEDIVFRLRHFDRKQTPREPKDAPLTYTLKSISDGKAVFENPERNQPRRFIFLRSGKDKFVVRLESEKDGNVSSSEFEYRRKI